MSLCMLVLTRRVWSEPAVVGGGAAAASSLARPLLTRLPSTGLPVVVAGQAELLAEEILQHMLQAAPGDRAPLVTLLAVIRQLFAGRGSLVERATELVDKRAVVKLTASGSLRVAYQVSSSRGCFHMVTLTPVAACSCEDFMFSVVKGRPDNVFVRQPPQASCRCSFCARQLSCGPTVYLLLRACIRPVEDAAERHPEHRVTCECSCLPPCLRQCKHILAVYISVLSSCIVEREISGTEMWHVLHKGWEARSIGGHAT